MELTFFAALAGLLGAFVVAGVWAGMGLVAGFGVPSIEQVQGLLLVGGCGVPIVGWVIALLNP